ncbi:MAG: glycosyltransferase [Nitrospirae bacterium]|nr:glycosyltransferase [Nitrospirota bacterium]
MNGLPVISVVTCTRNSARYLEEALRSVLDQRYPRLDYWVIDGGSTDGTLEILRRYEGRLRWVSEPDRGIADAMNKGIRLSTGDIVAHLHSDDLFREGALDRAARLLQAHPETGWLIGNYSEIDRHGRLIKTLELPQYDYDLLRRWNFIGHQAVFVRRRQLEAAGLFDPALRFAMDYDLWLRLGRLGPPLQVPEVLASMRFHPGGLTAAHIFGSLADEYAVRRRLQDRTAVDKLADFIDYQWRRLRYCRRYLRYLRRMREA